MGLEVTAKQDEVSGIPIPALRGLYEAIGDGPIVLDLEAFVEWQGKGTRATGYIGPFGLMGERKERLTRKYSIQYDDWAEMPGCDDAGPEAVETVLSALGACIINQTAWHAARMGIVLEALSVKVNMSFDAQGFFQNTDQTDKFSASPTRSTSSRRARARRSSPTWPTSAATARSAGCSARKWC